MKTGIISTLSGAVGAVVGMVFGAAATKKTFTEEINKWKEMSDRHLALFLYSVAICLVSSSAIMIPPSAIFPAVPSHAPKHIWHYY